MDSVIWHLSDLHIRNGYHDDILYGIKQLTQNLKARDFVVIAGDIFENKLKYSQYDLACFHKILEMLKEARVIIIPGYHDFMQSEEGEGSLDLISGALLAHNHPHVAHYPRSGVYVYDNVEFHVYSPMDKLVPIMERNVRIKVAILHEPIAESAEQNVQPAPRIQLLGLQKYHLVLAGYEHKHRFLTPRIAFCGSFVQKNRTEELEHGVIKWVYKNNQFFGEFIPLRLFNASLVLSMEDDVISYPSQQLFERTRYVELRHKNSTDLTVESVTRDIKVRYGRLDSISNLTSAAIISGKDVPTPAQFTEVEEQIKLLRDFLVEESRCEEVISLHKEYTHNITTKVRYPWRLNYLAWSNILCYGADNFIDFSNLQGIASLIGKNKTGKSAIIDALLFVLYNHQLRGTKKNLMNHKAENYKISCSFTIFRETKETYIVERADYKTATRSPKKGKAPLKPKFRLLRVLSEMPTEATASPLVLDVEDITPADLSAMYEFLEDLIGGYKDIMHTNIAEQNHPFIVDRNVSEQTRDLIQYMGLDKLQSIETQVKSKVSDLKKEVKALTKYTESPLKDKNKSVDELSSEVTALEKEKTALDEKISKHQEQRVTLVQNLHPAYKNITAEQVKKCEEELAALGPVSADNQELKNAILAKRKEVDTAREQLYPGLPEQADLSILTPNTDLKTLEEQISKNDETIALLESKRIAGVPELSLQSIQQRREKLSATLTSMKETEIQERAQQLAKEIGELSDRQAALPKGEENKQKTEFTAGEIKERATRIRTENNIEEMRQKFQPVFPNPLSPALKKLLGSLNIEGIETKIKELREKAKILEVQVSCQPNREVWKFSEECTSCKHNRRFVQGNTEPQEELKKVTTRLNHCLKYLDYLRNEQARECLNILNDEQYWEIEQSAVERAEIEGRLDMLRKEQEEIRKCIQLIKCERNAKIQEKLAALTEENAKTRKILAQGANLEKIQHNAQLRTHIQNVEKEIEEMKAHLDIVQKASKLQERIEICRANLQIKNEVALVETEIKTLRTHLKEKENLLLQAKVEYQRLLDYNKNQEEMAEVQRNLQLYEIYLKALDAKKGIPAMLLRYSLHVLQHQVNTILSTLTDFQVHFAFVRNLLTINVVTPTSDVPAALASGSQKFIIDLALRLCLASHHPFLPSFMIIDEGFGCMDSAHLQNAKDFLQQLQKQNRFSWMLLISHIEDLHFAASCHLFVNHVVDSGLSTLRWGHPPPEALVKRNNSQSALKDDESDEDAEPISNDEEDLFEAELNKVTVSKSTKKVPTSSPTSSPKKLQKSNASPKKVEIKELDNIETTDNSEHKEEEEEDNAAFVVFEERVEGYYCKVCKRSLIKRKNARENHLTSSVHKQKSSSRSLVRG